MPSFEEFFGTNEEWDLFYKGFIPAILPRHLIVANPSCIDRKPPQVNAPTKRSFGTLEDAIARVSSIYYSLPAEERDSVLDKLDVASPTPCSGIAADLDKGRMYVPETVLTPAQFHYLQTAALPNERRRRWRQVYNSRIDGFNFNILKKNAIEAKERSDYSSALKSAKALGRAEVFNDAEGQDSSNRTCSCILVLSTMSPDEVNNYNEEQYSLACKNSSHDYIPPPIFGVSLSHYPFANHHLAAAQAKRYYGSEATFAFRTWHTDETAAGLPHGAVNPKRRAPLALLFPPPLQPNSMNVVALSEGSDEPHLTTARNHPLVRSNDYFIRCTDDSIAVGGAGGAGGADQPPIPEHVHSQTETEKFFLRHPAGPLLSLKVIDSDGTMSVVCAPRCDTFGTLASTLASKNLQNSCDRRSVYHICRSLPGRLCDRPLLEISRLFDPSKVGADHAAIKDAVERVVFECGSAEAPLKTIELWEITDEEF